MVHFGELEGYPPAFNGKTTITTIKPSYYKKGKVECIDAIESATINKRGTEAFLVGNIIKYLWRYEDKGGITDIEKAEWYMEKLLELLKQREANNANTK